MPCGRGESSRPPRGLRPGRHTGATGPATRERGGLRQPREATMSSDIRSNGADKAASGKDVDMKMEVAIIPVANVARAKDFYTGLGWRLDRTPPGIVQLTPHGSGCSVQFGTNLTDATPGSAKEYLAVSDIEEARNKLLAAGVNVSDYTHLGPDGPEPGIDPDRRSYFSRA